MFPPKSDQVTTGAMKGIAEHCVREMAEESSSLINMIRFLGRDEQVDIDDAGTRCSHSVPHLDVRKQQVDIGEATPLLLLAYRLV
jgi:hypothetical protein